VKSCKSAFKKRFKSPVVVKKDREGLLVIFMGATFRPTGRSFFHENDEVRVRKKRINEAEITFLDAVYELWKNPSMSQAKK